MSEPRPLPLRASVRGRLLLITLLPLLILLPLLLLTSVKSLSQRLDEVLIAKVHSELTIARQHLLGLQESRGAALESLGQSAALMSALRTGEDLAEYLEGQRRRLGLDFLYYVDSGGQPVVAATLNRAPHPLDWPVVRSAMGGRTLTAIDVFSATDLASLSPALAQRATIPLVPTRAAVPTDRENEDRGLVIHAAAHAPGGAIVGGVLLNRNLGFIDDINALVYPEGSLTGSGQGTATLFLDDVRISTNVRLFEDVRALGTRVSAEVRKRVLTEGRTWLDRAFVVNDWYVSGYQPLADSFGRIVGMLYVGFLERDFAQAQQKTLWQIGLTFLVVVLVSVPVLLLWARSIFRPLERMNAVIGQVEAGQFGARVGRVPVEDEIARVAHHLDTLLDQLEQRDRSLREWADALEHRVAERTRDLEAANHQLDLTTRQLIVSEKLAAIGEITAGVAHEINNPLAVIQGNLDVIRSDLGPAAAPLEVEFALIQDRIQAIHVLIGKLLRFARPEEFADPDQGIDAAQTLRDTLPLLQHLLAKGRIDLKLHLEPVPQILMNRTELQQVLVNLCVNAIQAMPDGGTLTLGCRPVLAEDRSWVALSVTDTGQGIDDAVARRIFDPFFTTKGRNGTGLGLSITRDIVQRAGGTIELSSTTGKGTVFTVRFPVMADGAAGVAESGGPG